MSEPSEPSQIPASPSSDAERGVPPHVHGPEQRAPGGHVGHTPFPAALQGYPQTSAAATTGHGHDGTWWDSLATQQPAEPERQRARRGAGPWTALLAGALAGALVGGGVAWAVASSSGGGVRTVTAGGGDVVIQNPQAVTNVTAAAAKALPSTVAISVTGGSKSGSGSGVVLDKEGHILTNQHVATLGGATASGRIQVLTSDGRVLDATLVGQDPLYDLAVIKVESAQLTPITWGEVDKLNVGDTTVAIGAPLGLPNSVSDGVVSNLTRSISVASSAVPDSGGDNGGGSDFNFSFPDGGGSSSARGSVSLNVVQTDAAINHGNSGGALVDAQGRLVGINVAIASDSAEGGNIGVGFAIRGDIAKRVADELIASGEASHGQLGVTIASSAAPGASNTRAGFTNGAKIQDVPNGSPAAAAGLRSGDVVVAVGGVPTIDATAVTATVRSYAGGSTVPVTLERSGKRVEVDVKLGSVSK